MSLRDSPIFNLPNRNPSFFEPAKIERKYEVSRPILRPGQSVLEENPFYNYNLSIEQGRRSTVDFMPKFLITGSRDWDDVKIIRNSLIHYSQWGAGFFREHGEFVGREWKPILISGNCPSGADLICETVGEALGFEVRRYPADWYPDWNQGRKDSLAGFARNQQMVDLNPDICLAFSLNESRGTEDCVHRARQAKVYTVVHYLRDVTTEWGV